ncbi:ABC transporter substrate-binding protein [Enterococcus faecium]|nr:ABC transporter substrate-binding protein [Enterococcus faecium]
MNYLFVKTIIPYFLKNTINRRIIITTLMKKADINFSFIFIILFVKLSETKLSIYVTQKNF